MLNGGVAALLLGAVALAIWSVIRSRYEFEICIDAGQPRIRKGKVAPAFLDSVVTICQDSGVAQAWIGGVRHGHRISLRFSRHISPGTQQRLRNAWHATL